MRPGRLMGLAVVLAAALWAVTLLTPPPTIAPAEAARHEGAQVVVAGQVRDIGPWGDGTRFLLAADGYGLLVLAEVRVDVDEGAWLEVPGAIGRWDGRLVLWADDGFDAVPGGGRSSWTA